MSTAKTQELRDRLHAQMAALLTRAGELRQSGEFRQWLDYAARFHHYSFGNSLLIMLQHPGATKVAGYRKWQTLGRQVRKGEKGIAILAPMPRHEETEDPETGEKKRVQTGLWFKSVHVFDISQTDGDDPPEAPEWKGQGRDERLETALLAYAADLRIKVLQEEYTGGALGWSAKGTMAYSDGGNVPRTIAHELAHELTPQWREEMGRAKTEALVDLVAAIVCHRFGVDVDDNAAAYVATWTERPDELLKTLDKAQRLASQIIEQVESRLMRQEGREETA